VFILVDDLGYGDLGCYGNEVHRTPNIDRMAAEGARFTDFYVTSPVCTPTRASFLTGKHPARFKDFGVLWPNTEGSKDPIGKFEKSLDEHGIGARSRERFYWENFAHLLGA
jgi:arylsulfatase A-like enzyme